MAAMMLLIRAWRCNPATDPNNLVSALINVGVEQRAAGRFHQARFSFTAALEFRPDSPDLIYALATALQELYQLEQAILWLRRGERLAPLHFLIRSCLGIALSRRGRSLEAVTTCRSAVVIEPSAPESWLNLGQAVETQDGMEAAARLYRRALLIRPEFTGARIALARALEKTGQATAALQYLKEILVLAPADTVAINNLGSLLLRQGSIEAAATHLQRVLSLSSDHSMAWSNLGLTLQHSGRFTAAIVCQKKALVMQPDAGIALNNLAAELSRQGRIEEAIAVYRRALVVEPRAAVFHSNLLMTTMYTEWPAARILDEHREFARRHQPPVLPAPSPDPAHHRLRIGYVSSDFRQHVAAHFFEPLLRAHDPNDFEPFCYSNTLSPDLVTARLKGLAAGWREIAGLAPQMLASRIAEDGIDILVDLAGHSAGNLLTTFALRPAPLQVTWLGYPGTTGLSAIDYRLVDEVTDPEGEADAAASEQLVRLGDGFLCYCPPGDIPELGALPCLINEAITFGSFNNITKINQKTIGLWCTLLSIVPKSRLLIRYQQLSDTGTQADFLSHFTRRGIEPGRVLLQGWAREAEKRFAAFNQVDIALDTMPYNGTTTTCETLWMGLPVITLLGTRHAARVSASLLLRLGLSELVAFDGDDYVARAATLAQDRPRLEALRAGLRQRMLNSPLTDAARFTRQVETAYKIMWQRKLAGLPPASFTVPGKQRAGP